MAKLRLGPIPDDKPIARTVKLSASLDAELRRYAEAYAREYGEISVERLIPAMLERFIRSDRGFRSRSVAEPGSRRKERAVDRRPSTEPPE